MGLHREYRRLKRLGPRGFFLYKVAGPFYAAPFWLRLWLKNWREVLDCGKSGAPLPPFHFRRGFTLFHEPVDAPLMLVREVMTERVYRRRVRQPRAGVLLDIGANIGLVTMDWATRIPKAIVHAYEPDPRTFAILRRNVEYNGLAERVRLYNEAVWQEPGTITLWRYSKSVATSVFRQPDAPAEPNNGGASAHAPVSEPITARTVTLGTVIERALSDGALGLVKVDIEGAEPAVLEGASPAELARAPQWGIEYHNGRCLNASFRCRVALERAGFRCTIKPRHSTQVGLIYARRK